MGEQEKNIPQEAQISNNQESEYSNEELQKLINGAQEELKDWGIDDLTTIEGVHLRKIGEDVLRRFYEQQNLGDPKSLEGLDPRDEIMARWLHDLYDIDYETALHDWRRLYLKDLDGGKPIIDNNGDTILFKTQEEAYEFKKKEGLKGRIKTGDKIADEFKDYIRKLREESQQL